MSGFPPQDIRSFLVCCAGEWLALRSHFELGVIDTNGAEQGWHSAEKGELLVDYLEPEEPGAPGGLAITPPDGCCRHLVFSREGEVAADGLTGSWQLRQDGSLELVMRVEVGEVHERIWFTKPNLRLRSCVVHPKEGSPSKASFSSEIRRIRPPAAEPG